MDYRAPEVGRIATFITEWLGWRGIIPSAGQTDDLKLQTNMPNNLDSDATRTGAAPVIRDATDDDMPAIGRLHVDSWRITYIGLLPRAFLDGLT